MSDERKRSKADLILELLDRRANTWVSVLDVIKAGRTLSHTKRISELKARGYVIINRVDKEHRSFYKLVRSGEQLRLLDVA